MNQEGKIEFILEVMPNVERIISLATQEQIELLYKQAHEKLDFVLEEACYG